MLASSMRGMPLPQLTTLLLSLPLCVGVDAQGVESPARDQRPSLLVLVTDDHPHDALGCAGHPVLQTPHMDSLASSGVRFTRAFVTTPICAASRASILTGRYERSHGYTFGQPPLSDEIVSESYPILLRKAGYRLGFVGKLGVRIPPKSREKMFDSFVSGVYPYFPKQKKGAETAPRHLTERNVDRAIDFIRDSKSQPFCLSVSFQAPHAEDANPDQYVWPASCDELYVDGPIAPPVTSDPAFVESLPEFLRSGLNRERWRWRFDTPEKREKMVRGYYRMLSGVDQGIGRLMKVLDDLDLRDNTVIVLMGDNGYFLGERGYAGKWTMHDRSTRVPLIIVDPRRDESQSGRQIDAFALNIDLAPSLLDWAGLDAPASMQGRSLRPLVDGESVPWREEVFTEHLWNFDRIPRTEALRTRGWKYIRYLNHPEFEELYDLSKDPLEENNLAGDPVHALRLGEFRKRCSEKAASAQ
jgi:arylsulfatase A-like enzyme